MYIENEYIGDQLYVIAFENGTHHIKEEIENGFIIIFSGHYDKCKDLLEQMKWGYFEQCNS